MSSCKFCGIAEGAPDRKGKPAHINRDGLCAPCYYVLERVKYQPDKLDAEQHAWFNDICRFNMQHGMFVPVAQRRLLQYLKPKEAWRCKKCGQTLEALRDESYSNYCTVCAETIRKSRAMPKVRNTRSDKGGQHSFTGIRKGT